MQADTKIKVYAVSQTEAFYLREISSTHRMFLNDIAYTNNFKYLATVGSDSMVKIWDYEFCL